ncbi:MAG: hypothetical protein N2316_09755, partial [Spirochaetes bacterium]|nr:hypothetical protein [Spirochaetota bacterium]
PAISTGVYGYPKEEACEVAINTVLEYMRDTGYRMQVVFVLFDEENYNIYTAYMKRLKGE